MRSIINISLPKEMARKVSQKVKKGRFASTSEYLRYLIRIDEVMADIENSRREFAAGKGKLLKSLKDLR
ncbi:MAG: hypothetical protein A3C71_00930 [Candidatus Yanofskybacteria bacterium RIFCSPHIGHO2_02_FULL_43_15c]|uniref:Uncharacterized protein n=1 Tax=Candidatus Yanofskybacteria bacterium RIFCSPHIGHO2_02_FULL_43_15c TaxID=1802679 RepID=A0A1F8FGK7_9BACT|nr:MAG: hypothetical protein A3C71_00930 [Candidatus Yanofskybacteria bacterium RIFCSPHIGHO2_02_FULL_43_15c]